MQKKEVKETEEIEEIEEISLSVDNIKENIYIIRGQKVMLDKDLARLYGVTTKRLNESVKRNFRRFPKDFMFQLTKEEYELCSRSQFATLNRVHVFSEGLGFQEDNLKTRGQNIKYIPMVFTEQGIAMLSSVLNSDRAIQVNIQIIRVFTRLHEMVNDYKDLKEKVEEMEIDNEINFTEIFRVIRLLTTEKEKTKGPFGFVALKE
ncbi:MAG: ORF6N domain-containing protein [bacterium]